MSGFNKNVLKKEKEKMIYVFNDCEKNDWNMVPLEEGDVKSFSLNSGNQSLIKITEDSISEKARASCRPPSLKG